MALDKYLFNPGDTLPAENVDSIDPDNLVGAGDGYKLVRLDEDGKIDSSIISIDYFGSGIDGDVTISSNTNLTRDMYYNNLTINSGITLNPNGYRIFVKETLTNNGEIQRNGNTGEDGSSDGGGNNRRAGAGGGGGGAGGSGGIIVIAAKKIINNNTIRAKGGNGGNGGNGRNGGSDGSGAGMEGGDGGAGATALSAGSIAGGVGGQAGTKGGNGISNGNGYKGVDTSQPISTPNVIGDLTTPVNLMTGKGGDAGGGGTHYVGGSGGDTSLGAVGTPPNLGMISPETSIRLYNIMPNEEIIFYTTAPIALGGSGGGGGAGRRGGGYAYAYSGGHGGAGGNGGNGGIIIILTNFFHTQGTLDVSGGDAGTGGNGGDAGSVTGTGYYNNPGDNGSNGNTGNSGKVYIWNRNKLNIQ